MTVQGTRILSIFPAPRNQSLYLSTTISTGGTDNVSIDLQGRFPDAREGGKI
jgi:hypothetical protein